MMNPTHLLPLDPAERLDHDITVIETGYGRSGYDAAYLLVDEGHAAFIDTGVNASVPGLLAALAGRGLAPRNVDWVLLTHVHLDHAGGAGQLMAALPNARLGVHPRGVRHMADPGPLMQAVREVYGEEFTEREYGHVAPVAPDRIDALEDGRTLRIGQRVLEVIDSPGHARHHVCFWDERSRSWFAGDAFGLCLREFRTSAGPAIVPTTSPSQFEPQALHATVSRLLARRPRAVFPTHYGEVLHPERLAPHLLGQIDAQVAAARAVGAGPDGLARLREAFAAIYFQALHAQGWQGTDAEMRTILGADLELNAQGVKIWLDRNP
jgi:glyoxylase-like metal-dependent hydrolase (beta-lactamase superfamily II)